MAIIRTKTVTQQFRELKIGDKTKIECADYTAPHSFAKAAAINIATHIVRKPKKPGEKYLIEIERIK